MSDEWIELNLPYWECDGADSFENRGLNKAGTLIQVDGNTYLIGNINENRGGCDCCSAFPLRAIVQRYRVVWAAAATRQPPAAEGAAPAEGGR